MSDAPKDTDVLLAELATLRKKNSSLRRQYASLEDDIRTTLSQLARLRQMIEYSSDILLLVDKEGTILDCNRAATEAVGVTRVGLHGRPLGEIWGDADQIVRPIRDGSKTSTSLQVGELLSNDGTTIPVEVHVVVFREGGQVYALAAARDIRERQAHELALQNIKTQLALADKRRQLDSQLQEENRLESLAKLAGGIAHDFNNIFGVVAGNIDLLEPSRPDDWKECISEARAGLLQATRLSAQLRSFANGGSSIRETIATTPWLRGAARFALSTSSIELIFNLHETPVSIEVDEGQMTQVLHNLLHNAQDAMDNSGAITVRTTLINEDSSTPSDIRLCIYVQDQGKGIPTEFRTRVFEPFFTTKAQGTGIGLATSFRIVRDHGGTLLLCEKPKEGECFCISLPVVSPAP